MLPIKRPIGFPTKNEATFVCSPPQIHLHLHLSMLLTRNVCKKNKASDHTPQCTENRQAVPSRQPSRGSKPTHSAPRSRYFIKDKYITGHTELPPCELWECPVLSLKVPQKWRQHWQVPWPTDSHLLHFHRDRLASLMLWRPSRTSESSTFPSPSFPPTLPSNLAKSIAFQRRHLQAPLETVKRIGKFGRVLKSFCKSHPQPSTVNLETPTFFWVWSF